MRGLFETILQIIEKNITNLQSNAVHLSFWFVFGFFSVDNILLPSHKKVNENTWFEPKLKLKIVTMTVKIKIAATWNLISHRLMVGRQTECEKYWYASEL